VLALLCCSRNALHSRSQKKKSKQALLSLSIDFFRLLQEDMAGAAPVLSAELQQQLGGEGYGVSE
jgi:hypothetical protein